MHRVISTERTNWATAAMATGLLLLVGCSEGQRPPPGAEPAEVPGRLVIFHAASLTLPFKALEEVLESRFAGLDVIRESSSSRVAIRKVTELGRDADIVASADEALLRDLMLPRHCSWTAAFARNRIVIAYTQRSRHRTEISADNWWEVLLRDDVNFGYCNPNMAPVGYRTLLTWRLADLYYADRLGGRKISEELRRRCPQQNIRPHCNELIPLLQSLSLDYTFQYRSVALQHRLEWLKLPDEIDLSSTEHADFYRKARAEISGKTRGSSLTKAGKPIVYGITIPTGAPNESKAIAYLELLLGEEGQGILEENFQEAIAPAVGTNVGAAPERLRPFLREETE